MAYRLSMLLGATVSAASLVSSQAASAQQAGATQLEQIDVQGQGQGQGGGRAGAKAPGAPTTGTAGVATADGNVAKSSRTATKTDLPINETPMTINVITPKQLEDRRPQNLQEAVAYTPGARVNAFGFDPRYDSFTIRGVDITYNGVFRDGLRQFNAPNGLFRLEPYGLESISILKGPASAIYGASASVGIIDLVTKRPTDYTFGEVEATTGSFDRLQGAFDIGGPANEAGTVLYRMTGLARDAGTELEAVKDNRGYIAPAITFKPSDDTKLTVLAEYMDSTTGGSAAYQNSYNKNYNRSFGAIKIPLAYKNFNDFDQKQARIGYEFEHRFSDVFTFKQNLRYSGLDTDQRYSGSQFNDTGRIIDSVRAFAVDSYLQTKIATGPAEHTILTGVDFGRLKYTEDQGFGSFTTPDIINTPKLTEKFWQTQNLTGVYAQDEIKLDRFRLVVGGRHDWLDSSYRALSGIDPKNIIDTGRKEQHETQWTGRVALSYVTPIGVTPFASYGTSFTANSGTLFGDAQNVAKPTRGKQAEAGFKYAIPGTNAAVNASVFNIKQTDGLIYAVSGTTNQQVQLDFRSRGFELEGTASLNNGVSFVAGYTYTDTKILKATFETEGKRISSVPKHAFAIWSGYDAPSGPLKGLGLGAGVRYTGFSYGDELNRPLIANKARAFVDAKVSYELENLSDKLKGLRVQVNATNLFNSVKQVCSSNYCYYDEGRRVIASLKYRW